MANVAGQSVFRRWPLFVIVVAFYLAFLGLTLASLILGLNAATWAFITVWPYPFLLALQRWVDAGNLWLGYGIGLVIVVVTGAFCQRLAGPGRPRGVIAWLLALLITFGSLSIVQYSTQGYAYSKGWPTDE